MPTQAQRLLAAALGLVAVVVTTALAPATPAYAAEPILVRDVEVETTVNVSSVPEPLLAVGERLFFGAEDPLSGRELWVLEQPGPARRVVDLCPGLCSSRPFSFLAFGSDLVFLAEDSDHGIAMWRTDGTAGGTSLIFEGLPGVGRGSFGTPWIVRGRIVFLTFEADRLSFWSSDGTRAGTRRYFSIPTVGEPTFAGAPVVTPGERLFFPLRTPSTGDELWVTDGTNAGTYPLGDLAPGPESGYCFARVGVMAGRVEFSAQRGGNDCELWTTDGSPAGTRLVADLAPVGGSFPEGFTKVGDLTYLSANTPNRGRELWVTDGTAAGTRALEETLPGTEPSFPSAIGAVGGRFVFLVFEGGRSVPFVTDGSPGSMRALTRDFLGNVLSNSWNVGDRLFFETFDPRGEDLRVTLWKTGGTPDTTTRVASFLVDSLRESRVAAWGDRLALGADLEDGLGDEPTVTGPSGAGLERLADVYAGPRGSLPRELTPVARRMFFTADDGAASSQLFRSAGTPATTVPLQLLGPNPFAQRPYELTRVGSGLVFAQAREGVGRVGLHGSISQRIAAGSSSRFVDTFASSGARASFDVWDSIPTPFPPRGSLLLFGTDGTATGTSVIATLESDLSFGLAFAAPRPEGDGSYWMTRVLHDDHEPEIGSLWQSDGTAAGTKKLLDRPCNGCGEPRDWAVARGGRQFFIAHHSVTDALTVWRSDGTADGTLQLAANGNESLRTTYSFLTVFDSPRGPLAIWTGFDAATGEEPWISDGTVQGTRRLKDLRGGRYGSRAREYTVVGNRVFFTADDGRFGRELWVTDGTTAGTRRFVDLLPGRRGSRAHNLTKIDLGGNAGARLVFSADDGVTGFEPWITDGTLAGTRRMADLNPGPDGSCASEFTRLGRDLWMSAARPETGYELWRIPLGN